jgi:group I intron endonuclease
MRKGVIYKLEIIGTKYFLYGSTINYKKRISRYKNNLINNKYKNDLLQRVYNKYGEDKLLFTIVQQDIPEDILLFVEDIWIGTFCSHADCKCGGMNMRNASKPYFSQEVKDKISKLKKGKKFTEKHKLNMSISQKGIPKPQSEENRYKSKLRVLEVGKKLRKKVKQIDIETGNVINIFESISEAGRILNISRQAIGLCCRNYKWVKTAAGFKWEYI